MFNSETKNIFLNLTLKTEHNMHQNLSINLSQFTTQDQPHTGGYLVEQMPIEFHTNSWTKHCYGLK
jgi:hypothetical protein